jgi:hypothetical protein
MIENLILSKPIIIYLDNMVLEDKNILVFNDKTNYAIKLGSVSNFAMVNINVLSISTKELTPQELMLNPYNLEWLDKYNYEYYDIVNKIK